MSEEELPFNVETSILYTQEDAQPNDTAIHVAIKIMMDYHPGFVIIGSPMMMRSKSGILFSESCGVIVNPEVEMTFSELAESLRVIADSLEESINEIENSVNEGNTNDAD